MNRSGIHIVKAGDKAGDSGFAAACSPYQSDRLARLDDQICPSQHRLAGSFQMAVSGDFAIHIVFFGVIFGFGMGSARISEPDIFKTHFAPAAGQRLGVLGIGDGGFFV